MFVLFCQHALTLSNHGVPITGRNHGLFDWKIRPKTNHFDIWSV